jgi:5-methylthioribose kinase
MSASESRPDPSAPILQGSARDSGDAATSDCEVTDDNVRTVLARLLESVPGLDPTTVTLRDVSGGNMNHVFVGSDADGHGFCIKQAMPYLNIDPTWPFTPERAKREYEALLVQQRFAPALTPEVFGYDEEHHALAMEDLSEYELLRTTLLRDEVPGGVVEQIGVACARMAHATSPYVLGGTVFRRMAAELVNAELCALTEDVIFTEPFVDHSRNQVRDGLRDDALGVWADVEVTASVARLKYKFLTAQQSFLHGDLHTGSVMIKAEGDGHAVRWFDPEFAFFGPTGFDLGLFLGNLLLAEARERSLRGHTERAKVLADLQGRLWTAFADELVALAAADRAKVDMVALLAEIANDAAGFGACEAMRRILHVGKVEDMKTLSDREAVVAERNILILGRRWLQAYGSISAVTDLPSLESSWVEA